METIRLIERDAVKIEQLALSLLWNGYKIWYENAKNPETGELTTHVCGEKVTIPEAKEGDIND